MRTLVSGGAGFKILIVATLLFLFSFKTSFAQSSYVLPYPSFMPGNKLYVLHSAWRSIAKYWYFGNFGQFIYNLEQSDKYLVEAKTLFEYRQYLLGEKALKKSDEYFILASDYLKKANIEGKDITQKRNLFKQAEQKHEEILYELKEKIPKDFLWHPEKEIPFTINLRNDVEKSLQTRKSCI